MSLRLKRIIFVVMTVSLMLAMIRFTNILGVFSPGGNVASFFFRIQSAIYAGTLRTKEFIFHQSRTKDELINETKRLEAELAKHIIDEALLNELLQENQTLRSQIQFAQENKLSGIHAQIIGGNADFSQKSFLLNRGSDSGVETGSAVIGEQGIVIGKITDVSGSFSTVLLLNDSQSSLAATIQNQNRTLGVVEGELGIALRMDLIPKDQIINEDDIIVTSGLEEKIPAGLVIGTIRQIQDSSNELFKNATIEVPIDYHNSTWVMIIQRSL